LNNRVLSWLTGVISNPVTTFHEISREKPVGWALAVYLAGVLLVLLALDTGFLFAVFWLFFAVVGIVILAGVFHLAALLLGGRGGYTGMVCALGFAGFLYFLIPPLYLLGVTGGIPVRLLVFAFTLLIMLWMLILYALGIKENYQLTAGKSVVVALTPLVLAGLSGVAAILLLLVVVAFVVILAV